MPTIPRLPQKPTEAQQLLTQADAIFRRGVTTLRDLLAPAALEVGQSWLRIGERYARTMFIFSFPRYLSQNWFSPVVNLDQAVDISLYIKPLETGDVLRKMQKKVAEVESQMIGKEEKGQVRDPMLETAYKDIEEMRDKLQQARDRLFQLAIYITIWGRTVEELDEVENVVRSLLEGMLVYVKPAIFQQEEGFKSMLPYAEDWLKVTTNLDAETIATSFPFVSFDLTMEQGIMYGINRHNNSLILFDRFSLPNANSVTFGVSGGGKSYGAKLEILRSLMLDTDVMVIDPENEYRQLAEATGGTFINISLTSKQHINPFDLPPPFEGETPQDVFRTHLLELVGLMKVALGKLTPLEEAVLDKAIGETYASRNITADSDLANATPPVLADLLTVLEDLEGGKNIAERLRKFTEGTYAGFLNHPTNIDLSQRFIVFSIRDLEDELRPVAIYLVLHFIWNAVRSSLKKRLLIIDEAWWLMQREDGASFLFSIAKRARKYFLAVSTITQDVSDFMSSNYGQPIVANSSMQFLFKQSPATIDAVQKTFGLTDEEKYLLLAAAVGEGLFFAGLKHVSLQVVASYTEDQIITSDPQQLLTMRQTRKNSKNQK